MAASLIPYDDRDGSIWYDGKLVPWRDAKIHVLTHALHYASAVFEGARAYGGTVFKLRDHCQRLIDSGRILGFEIPWTREQIEAACKAAVKAQNIKDGYVRPIAWRGPEQMGVSAQQTKIHMAVAAWDWGTYFAPEARLKGIRMAWAKWARPAPNTAPTKAKAAGLYMICTLSKHAAEAEGYEDALMLDWRGQLAEATGANIFLAIDGTLHTPTPDCFLDGITRRHVIGLARARQIKVVERPIMPDELGKAQEVFLTGSAAEITPVCEIGQYRFTPGTLTKQLIEDFDRSVRAAEKASAA
ncbi:MAG: branched-chain amino acid aminotransferase [Alphaproteobacteria bacterium]|nr:branched-chain amino acid aminotransferase [Alphaproteobacteria bacterium]